MSWYVLYTKPRNEKKVTQRLLDKGVNVYCPLKEEVRQWSDRKKKVSEPVFRSYIFVKLDNYELDNVDILTTPGTVRFLWWNGKPGIVREKEIEAIKSFLNDYKDAEITIELQKGQDIEVMEGPLKEARGKVLEVKGNRATLHLKSLGMNIIAKLAVQSLKKLGNG